MTSGLRILFEDEHCLAVLKPAGQLTQGNWAPPGETTLEQDVRLHLDPRKPDAAYVGIVHRLDRPVSGVLLWAKTLKAARRLATQFEKRQVVKEYWAIVEAVAAVDTSAKSTIPAAEDTWVDWLTAADDRGVVSSVAAGTIGARESRTRAIVDSSVRLPAGRVWLRFWPETGRTHQLRVQSATRGMPILGDRIYGATGAFDPGIALHARRLQVRHPTTSAPMILNAPLPESWQAFGLASRGDDAP